MNNSLQEQLSEIQSQLNFILTSLAQLSCELGIQRERINIVENNTNDLLTTVIEITHDSELKH
jgi:hypothetical protein